MSHEIALILKPDFVQRFKDGYPLISKEFIRDWSEVTLEGSIIKLFDEKINFVAKGYYGVQNKGYGWILSREENEKIDTTYFLNKISSAIKYREEFFKDTETTAFRVFNGEGDGVGGLSIDYFDGYYLLTWYSIGIFEFRKDILEALKLIVDYKGVYQKKRFDTKGKYLNENDDFVYGLKAPKPIIVKENGVNFAVYLNDGAMVGIFLYQREVRKTIRDKYAKGKTALNTFSYTGAFSVFAAIGGATRTTSVDLAKRSLAKTREQFKINSLNLDKQNIIVEDVFDYFNYAVRKKLNFDIVIVDPPSFARSKKRTFSANKDYVKLLKEVIAITSKDGLIVASTNSANFGMMAFRDFIKTAFKELKIKYKVQESFSLPKDFKVLNKFKESNYLKVVFIRRIS